MVIRLSKNLIEESIKSKIKNYFRIPSNNARMAELVDALVSNTSAFTGMPVRLRLRVRLN